LFVHKIAGEMAEAGSSLEQIAAHAQRIIDDTVSIGISLDTCTVPGSAKEDRIPVGQAELGLGIHGEPGVEQVSFIGAKDAMGMVLNKLRPHMAKGPCVALLNNLGATTSLEMSVLANTLAQEDSVTHVVGPAAMMTALDMHGFSVSIMPLSADDQAALATPVNLAAWPGLQSINAVEVTALSADLAPSPLTPSSDDNHRAVLTHVADVLIGAEKQLNELDAKSGDGDTGSTLATAAKALKDSLDKLPLAEMPQLLPTLGNELGQTMGGSSGVIMAIFFNAAGDAQAKAGRAAYVPSENLDGHNDPGAEAVALVFEGLADLLKS